MRGKPSLALPDDARTHAVVIVREYFSANMDEELSELKAGLLLDFMVSEIGPTIYNQAIADARAFFDERSADLSAACYHAEFPTTSKRRRA